MEGISIKTILYVLFAIGWLYFNYLKKKANGTETETEQADLKREQKKTVAEDPVLENVPSKKTSFEEVSSVPAKANMNMPNQSASNLMENDLFHKVDVDDLHRPSEKKEIHFESTNTDDLNIGHPVMSDLDLKNMVIYHEIIKRPNY